jgi:hypothetical protein
MPTQYPPVTGYYANILSIQLGKNEQQAWFDSPRKPIRQHLVDITTTPIKPTHRISPALADLVSPAFRIPPGFPYAEDPL